MKKKVLAVIPARYSSTRLPAKPLADINGYPLIYYVWKEASQSLLIDRLIIATDDVRIESACKQFGADVMMTPPELPSGSDRVLFVSDNINENFDYVMNIQGDEPLISGELLDGLIEQTIISKADIGTVVKKIDNYDELFNNSVVKVVLNKNSNAIYFSRSPVPFLRDIPPASWPENADYWKHIGLYLYTRQAIKRFGELPQSPLEMTEKLEQLRLLEDGATFHCYQTKLELFGIDTPEDLEKFRQYISGNLS